MAQIPSGGPFGYAGNRQQLGYRSSEAEMSVGNFFNVVYAWMAVGLALTAATAYGLYEYTGGRPIIPAGGAIVLFLVEIGLVYTISNAINRINATVATALFMLFAALNGVMLSSIFIVYTHTSIATVFLVTGGAFAATSIYGFTTKRDLTALGSLLFMALIGLILASVVNWFLHSTLLQFALSYLGVVIFVGLTAYDTQKLKNFAYSAGGNVALANRVAIVGSLTLYLDFINLFLQLLQIMGDRRR